MPLHVEILYNEYNFVAAFAVASLLALLALVTLAAKSFLEWRYGDALSGRPAPLSRGTGMDDPRRRHRKGVRRAPPRCAASRSTCGRASCSLCSARPAQARRRCCASSRDLSMPDRGQVLFGGEDATTIPVQRAPGRVRLPTLCPVSPYDGGQQHRLRAAGPRPQPAALGARHPAPCRRAARPRPARGWSGAIRPSSRAGNASAWRSRGRSRSSRACCCSTSLSALSTRKVRKDLRRWLRDVHERTGQTTVFVTHDQDEALELADRVAILNDGRLEQLGTPDEIHDDPASPFVMSFVGETSRLPVSVADGKVLFEDRRLSLRADGVADGPGDLYVRPWDLRLHTGDGADLVGTVRAIRRVGAARRAEVALGDEASFEIDLPPGNSVLKGAPLQIQILRGRVFSRTMGSSLTDL